MSWIFDFFSPKPLQDYVAPPPKLQNIDPVEALEFVARIKARCEKCTEERRKFEQEFGAGATRSISLQDCAFSLRVERSDPALLQSLLAGKFGDHLQIDTGIDVVYDWRHSDIYNSYDSHHKLDCRVK